MKLRIGMKARLANGYVELVEIDGIDGILKYNTYGNYMDQCLARYRLKDIVEHFTKNQFSNWEITFRQRHLK